jgi:hypothetical protein
MNEVFRFSYMLSDNSAMLADLPVLHTTRNTEVKKTEARNSNIITSNL